MTHKNSVSVVGNKDYAHSQYCTVIDNLNKWKANLIIKTVEKWLECIEKYSCYCLFSSHYLIYSSPALSSASNHMLQCSIYLGSFGPACAFISETAIKIWWKRKALWDCSRFPDPSWMLRGGKGRKGEREVTADAGTKTWL